MSKTVLLSRALNFLTVRAEHVEAQAAFRHAQGERALKVVKAGSISRFVQQEKSQKSAESLVGWCAKSDIQGTIDG